MTCYTVGILKPPALDVMALEIRPSGTSAPFSRQLLGNVPSSTAVQPPRKAAQQLQAIAAPEKVLESLGSPSENGVSAKGLNKYSRNVTQVKQQGGSQAMLYATGLSDDDFDKPQVPPCTLHCDHDDAICMWCLYVRFSSTECAMCQLDMFHLDLCASCRLLVHVKLLAKHQRHDTDQNLEKLVVCNDLPELQSLLQMSLPNEMGVSRAMLATLAAAIAKRCRRVAVPVGCERWACSFLPPDSFGNAGCTRRIFPLLWCDVQRRLLGSSRTHHSEPACGV